MKPLLVGEAPSKNEATEMALEGRVGRRLAQLCGMTYEQYLCFFERVNLLHVRQDTKEKGFEFDRIAALRAVHALFMEGKMSPGRIVLLLGRRVARAFEPNAYKDMAYFEERRSFIGVRFYVLPHPSGVNRWWNEGANYRRAVEFMQSFVASVEKGQRDA